MKQDDAPTLADLAATPPPPRSCWTASPNSCARSSACGRILWARL